VLEHKELGAKEKLPKKYHLGSLYLNLHEDEKGWEKNEASIPLAATKYY
jgi:hypothetical protein